MSEWGTVRVRSLPDHFYVHMLVTEGDAATNPCHVDILQEHYKDALAFNALEPLCVDERVRCGPMSDALVEGYEIAGCSVVAGPGVA